MVQLKCKLQGCDLSPRPREHKMGAEPIYCSREHAVLGCNYKTKSREKLEEIWGISYDQVLGEQGGTCDICDRKCTKNKRLSFDHCHSTGKFRGLLCDGCNVGLGNSEIVSNCSDRPSGIWAVRGNAQD